MLLWGLVIGLAVFALVILVVVVSIAIQMMRDGQKDEE